MTGGRLAGRSCLIVGGTGGIGQAAARRFVQEGARVVLAGLAPGLGAQALRAIGPADRVSQLTADASRGVEVMALFAEVLPALGGRLDVLLHAAGISGRRFGDGPLHECSEEGWERVMAINARGLFLTNREAVRIMRAQEPDAAGLRGSVVNVGSVLAESPAPRHFGTVAYAASKGAARSLTLAAASRYAAEAVRFNLIEPGLIATPMASRATDDPDIRVYLRTKQPMTAGPGQAEDVAEAALYLSEPSARFLTGVILTVDGGWRVCEGQDRAGTEA